MQVYFSNQQRKHKLNPAWFKTIGPQLLGSTISIVKENYPQEFVLDKFNDLKNKLTFNVHIISNLKIKAINKQFRNINKATDVLSFKLVDINDPYLNFLDEVIYGELFISMEKAIEQSQNLNHSLERELIFLYIHGLLHLFDFDHENEYDKKIMFDLQKKILRKNKIPRNFESEFTALIK